MTVFYVDDDGSDTWPYSSWGGAANDITTVFTSAVAGDIIKVETTHVQNVSTGDFDLNGPTPNPGPIVVRVDKSDSDSYDPDGSTENFQTTGGNYEIDLNNAHTWYGMRFNSNELIRVGGSDSASQRYVDCVFTVGSTSALNVSDGAEEFIDCTVDTTTSINRFNQLIHISATPRGVRFVNLVLANTSAVGHRQSATYLWNPGGPVEFIGCDFSAMTRSDARLTDPNGRGFARFIDCKLPPNHNLPSYSNRNVAIELIRCDGTDDYQYASTQGTLISEATIVRTGGAPKSWEITTRNRCGATVPFCTPWIYGFVDSTGSKDFDLHFAYSGTRLTEEEIYMEVELMDSASTPYGSTITTQKRAVLGDTVGNPTTATETWGGTETYEEYLRVTATVGVADTIVRARICVEKTSQTDEIYVDPYLEIG